MSKSIIGTIIIFLLLILGTIFFLWPKYQAFNNLKFEIKERKTELENKEKYFSELNNISSKLKDYSVEFSKIDSALATNAVAPEVINFLAQKSSQNGLILEKVDLGKISPMTKDSKIQMYPFNLSLSGFYPALRNFLSSLQQSAKLIEVDSVKFSEAEKGGIFSFDLKITTYSY